MDAVRLKNYIEFQLYQWSLITYDYDQQDRSIPEWISQEIRTLVAELETIL